MMATAASLTPSAAISSTASSPAPSPPWSSLLPDLLIEILNHLRPTDIAGFRAVCRAWHSAARHYQQQLPWVVLPNGSYGTMNGTEFFQRVPGLPDNVTCLGATSGWLALDRTDDMFRRTNCLDTYDTTTFTFLKPRHNVRHKHSYMIYNPFTDRTVPLPELDTIAGDVPETFEIRKVLMRHRSASRPPDDDLVAVITNNRNYTMIVCRPGKGRWVLPYLGIMDIAFFGDALYAMTMDGDLLVFELAPPEEEKDGKPVVVSRLKGVISRPLADGEEDELSWIDDYVTIASDDELDDNNDELTPTEDDLMMVGDGKVVLNDEEMPHEPKDQIAITRRLVESCDGQELLMVRHQEQTPAHSSAYTRNVDIFKADMDAGQWVPVVTATALSKGEALFLSRASSMAIQAYGDIKEGSVYFVDMDESFDTRSGTYSPVTLPRQRKRAASELLIWLFPPQLVL